jgi:hypothetical protein
MCPWEPAGRNPEPGFPRGNGEDDALVLRISGQEHPDGGSDVGCKVVVDEGFAIQVGRVECFRMGVDRECVAVTISQSGGSNPDPSSLAWKVVFSNHFLL